MCDLEIRNVDLSDPKVFEEVISTKLDYWNVDEFGNMSGKYGQEIPCERLTEQNWLDHFLIKEGNSLSKEFYFAYIEALQNAGYKKLIINLEDTMHHVSAEK